MGRAFIGPDGQLHGAASASNRRGAQAGGRTARPDRRPARSPGWGVKTSSIDHLVVRPSASSGLARPEPADGQVGRASRQRSSCVDILAFAELRTPAAGAAARSQMRGADRACRPRSAPCPAPRDRKRASGISSCESGRRRCACLQATGRDSAQARAGAGARGGVTRRNALVDAERIGAARSQAWCLRAQREGRGDALLRPAPSSACAVSPRKGWASRSACPGRPAATRLRVARGQEPDRADAEPSNRRTELVLDHVGSAPTTRSARRIGGFRAARGPAPQGRCLRPG
jgi:hypothetical protein